MKVILCYTAENADSDWLEQEYEIDSTNYQYCVDDYIIKNSKKVEELNNKWGGEDSLYLNFRSAKFGCVIHPTIHHLLNEYMNILAWENKI
jgi:hypothetical protein